MSRQLVQFDRKRQLYLPGFTLSAVGMTAGRGVTQDDWDKAGDFLGEINKRCMWYIGDWHRIGRSKKWANDSIYDGSDERFGISVKTAQNVTYVCDSIEVARRRAALSFSHHVAVSPLATKQQDRFLDLAEKHGWSSRELREEVKAYLSKARLKSNPLPTGKWRVIYADPPWKYSDELIDGYGAAEHHYPTMSIDELCELKIGALCHDDAVLFIWTTSPLLDETFSVIEAWGFEYKTSFVWDKVDHNYGHYNSVRHEFLLVCTRGSCLPDSSELQDSVVVVKRSEVHSQKPEEFYELIESLYTGGDRIELFARAARDGWDSWGDEI